MHLSKIILLTPITLAAATALWDQDVDLHERDVEELYDRDLSDDIHYLYTRMDAKAAAAAGGQPRRPITISAPPDPALKNQLDDIHAKYKADERAYFAITDSGSAENKALAKKVYDGQVAAKKLLVDNADYFAKFNLKANAAHETHIKDWSGRLRRRGFWDLLLEEEF